jgi:hypothetical protein
MEMRQPAQAVYGGRLWRPVLNLEFARLVQQSLGTSALVLSYVFVYIIAIISQYDIYGRASLTDMAIADFLHGHGLSGQDVLDYSPQYCRLDVHVQTMMLSPDAASKNVSSEMHSAGTRQWHIPSTAVVWGMRAWSSAPFLPVASPQLTST